MAVYERINRLIEENGWTKRHFAQKFIALSPISRRTGETMSEKTVYTYLDGSTCIDADMLSFIAEALHVPEQSLFDTDEKTSRKIIKSLLKDLNEQEHTLVCEACHKHLSPKHQAIIELLPYASEKALDKMEQSLIEMKRLGEQAYF